MTAPMVFISNRAIRGIACTTCAQGMLPLKPAWEETFVNEQGIVAYNRVRYLCSKCGKTVDAIMDQSEKDVRLTPPKAEG